MPIRIVNPYTWLLLDGSRAKASFNYIQYYVLYVPLFILYVVLLRCSSCHRKCDDFNSGLANKYQHRRPLEGWSRIPYLSHRITYTYIVVVYVTAFANKRFVIQHDTVYQQYA